MATDEMDSFDLFGLPRELRDLIYDELDGHDEYLNLKGEENVPTNGDQAEQPDNIDCPYLRASAQRLPHSNYLLVNHQFRQEYLSRTTRASVLVLDDHFGDPEETVKIRLPPAVTSFTRLHFRLTIACGSTSFCRHMQELRAHLERAKHIAAQMPGLRHFTIELHCYSDSLEDCLPDIISRQHELDDVFPERMTAMVGFRAQHHMLSVEYWNYEIKGECVLNWDRAKQEMLLVPVKGEVVKRDVVEEVEEGEVVEVVEVVGAGAFNG